MSLKYVLSNMRKRVLRTIIIALALTMGVALVGALLALVDTQRQFSVQAVGTSTGGFDLGIARTDLAASPFFNFTSVAQAADNSYGRIAQSHPRIQVSAEARLPNAFDGQVVTVVALDGAQDDLVTLATGRQTTGGVGGLNIRIGGGGRGGPGGGPPGGSPGGPAGSPNRTAGGQNNGTNTRGVQGTYPPEAGQIFLDSATAGVLGAAVGDQVQLAYALPAARELGQVVITSTSSPRLVAKFTVSGIGTLDGLTTDATNAVIMQLSDAQSWLNAPAQSNQLLLVWQAATSGSNDATATVSSARNVGESVRVGLQQQLGTDFNVTLPKYTRLEANAQAFTFQQTFITLYGLLSMGIIGLMVNALMNTTVMEMKHDLAVLRVLGSARYRLFQIVIVEVVLLGIVGIVAGLLVGRAMNDFLLVPTLLANLNLPSGVRASWTLQTVLIPTGITIIVLALATISPARAAANTKVMIVLNPAAADQPTLDDLSKLRERKAQTGLLLGGFILIAFSALTLIVVPTVFRSEDATGTAIIQFGSLLLMVIGASLLFYFFTAPLERVLIFVYQLVNPTAGYFAGRYALRGKGRNALISLMVVMSGVLPCLLATQLALQKANVETDSQFNNGAQIVATTRSAGGNFNFFRRGARPDANLSDADIAAVKSQRGIGTVVGVADNLPNMAVSDVIGLRTENVSYVGVESDLNTVLYPSLFRWIGGDASALTRIVTDTNGAIISQGLSQFLDLKVGDPILLKGKGNDHSKTLTIVAVVARVPGFTRYFTRNKADADRSGIFMNLGTYRDLMADPALGKADPTVSVLTKLFATVGPGVDESTILRGLRTFLGNQNDMTVVATSEQVAQQRNQLGQSEIFIILLTGLSMVTAIFGVLAVMYTAVMGRRIEIGMLKAVGAARGALRGVFVGEAVITTLAAGIAGIVAGTLLGYAFEGTQRIQNDQIIRLAFDFQTAGLIIAMVCIAAIFSSVLATQPVITQKAIKILRER